MDDGTARPYTRDVSATNGSAKEFDLRNTESLEECVRHSDIVYNLVGRDYPTKFVLFAHRTAALCTD